MECRSGAKLPNCKTFQVKSQNSTLITGTGEDIQVRLDHEECVRVWNYDDYAGWYGSVALV